MANTPSRVRSLVGLVDLPGGTASLRPPAVPAITRVTPLIVPPRGGLPARGQEWASGGDE
nr:hypothetical protein GCM10017588_09800 [Microbispora rosea subsp. aerata]